MPTTFEPAPPPPGFRLVHHFILTERSTLLWMNVIGTVLFVLALVVVLSGLTAYGLRGAPLVIAGAPESLPVVVYALLIVATLLLHEALHGLAILLTGNRPRFGIKLSKLVLFTTSEAYFTRRAYLGVTLAPLLGITVLGGGLMLLLPVGVAAWIGVAVAMNAASAIGDLWMAAVIASFPASACFHDEADGMTVYLPE